MSPEEAEALFGYLTPEEQAELDKLVEADAAEMPWVPLPGPQSMAFESEADIVGYGGAAGGGKTDLIAGLASTVHFRSLIVRREKAQTEGVVQRLTEIHGSTDGFSSQKAAWRMGDRLIEFAGCDNPGDEKRWQGRAHDLKAFDEVTEQREAQVRFIMGWTRSSRKDTRARVLMTFNPPTTADGRWVLEFFGPWLSDNHPNPAQPGELRWFTTIKGKDVEVPDGRAFVLLDGKRVYDFEPTAYKAEDIIEPKSRTFIPARLTDNPYYMATGYMSQLQALPEPLRSQMLYGDFKAGITEDPLQVIPTKWVEIAMARWTERRPRGEMIAMGVDVARGGADQTTIAPRHKTENTELWFDKLRSYPGQDTPNGPTVAGLVIGERRDEATILLDVIGVGASPYDVLNGMGLDIYGVNVSTKATSTDRSGKLTFLNLRSQLWWKFRELLDPAYDTGITLPPDPQLLSELCAPKWKLHGMSIAVESRDEIVKRIGRSPDRATAVVMCAMDVPKRSAFRTAMAQHERDWDYDPHR